MFYFLHRLVKWTFVALIAAGLYWLWQQREALDPIYVWYDVYGNGGLQNDETLPVIQGKGVHVIDGHTFQMIHNKAAVSVRLTGFAVPQPPMPEPERELEVERRRILRNAVLEKEVSVKVTYAENGSVLGIVTAGKTNLNLLYLTNGLSRFHPEYIKSVPRDVQYQFFAARRLREKQLEKQTTLAMRAETSSSDRARSPR